MTLPLLDENQVSRWHMSAEKKRRRDVLRNTVQKLSIPEMRQHCHEKAIANHEQWKKDPTIAPYVIVEQGDWGETAKKYSQATGEIYAVLNMANAFYPGGSYRDGVAAQEENMFRRTDCHFHIKDEDVYENGTYISAMHALINGANGKVYLDKENPRVCIVGSESQKNEDGFGHGYEDLPEEDYFLFYELRAAADNLQKPEDFNEASMRRKIRAQLDTLKENNIRHVILSAFGCGAFNNPPEKVASLYKEELLKDRGYFDSVVFAIYVASRGIDNYPIFSQILDRLPLTKEVQEQYEHKEHREPEKTGSTGETEETGEQREHVEPLLIRKEIKLLDITDAIHNYLENRDNNLSCFSFWCEHERGKKRAECFQTLFKENEQNQAVCYLLVYCMLASHDGINLKQYLTAALKYETRDEALAFMQNKLREEYGLNAIEDIRTLNREIIGPIVRLTNSYASAEDIQLMIRKFNKLISKTDEPLDADGFQISYS